MFWLVVSVNIIVNLAHSDDFNNMLVWLTTQKTLFPEKRNLKVNLWVLGRFRVGH